MSQTGTVRPLRPEDLDNLFIDLPDWLSADNAKHPAEDAEQDQEAVD